MWGHSRRFYGVLSRRLCIRGDQIADVSGHLCQVTGRRELVDKRKIEISTRAVRSAMGQSRRPRTSEDSERKRLTFFAADNSGHCTGP
jgi:hypothetical protein